jgi:molybdopterin/thiamine biosynthesis adenylyltransferase
LVLDRSDISSTHFLTNESCFLEEKTLASGALLRFGGRLSTFKPHVEGLP